MANNKEQIKLEKRKRRRAKIRSKISGSKNCPRLSVFRSNTGMYVQLIDDEAGNTLASAHSREIKKPASAGKNKEDKTALFAAENELGKLLAVKAAKKKIQRAVFDRGGYKYHGRVKAVAEGAREGGLRF